MQLVIDARMLGKSGIGVYLENVLPIVCERCSMLDPWILCTPSAASSPILRLPEHRIPWAARPLTLDEWSRPPLPRGQLIWWAPHFNVPLRFTGPLVVTLHDLMPLVADVGLVARLAVRHWVKRITRHARRVLCVSEFTRRHAIELANIDLERTRVIPLGARQFVEAQSRSHVTGAKTQVPYILFVGLAKPHKNLEALLRAFERVAARVPHRLIIVGRTRGLRRADRSAIDYSMRISSRVDWREDVADSELGTLLCGADLLVQPSLFEGFGLPPLEAMACGTPVLAARAGAIPEVCGDAVRYCDPASVSDMATQLLDLLLDPQARALLAAAGRLRAAGFSWRQCADRTANEILAAANESHDVTRVRRSTEA